MASRLRNSRSALRACLQTTITSSFHLQIAYRLKRWTPDFPRFETRYRMHNLSSKKCFKNVSNSSEIEVRHFRSWFAQSSSNGHNFSVSNPNQPFRSCEMRVTVLRNEGHCAAKWHSCAKIAFAAAKYPAEWDFGCEIENFHALELRSRFAAAK
uniref:Uncharacterized protein n=1 Tax=Vitis vinifera TaxID=29760 RepID=A5ADA0_VITVI|nr:hypothetical protein VITISV_016302 [Vitis vinifera]